MSGADLVDGLSLEVVAGRASGSTLTVGERLVFGRGSDGPGRLADDPELSRHHAQILLAAGGEYLLDDLASRNGTYVNGVRVQAPVALSAGDMIDLGATRLIVREAPSPAAPEPPVDVRAATVPGGAAIPGPPPEPPPAPEPPPPVPEPAPPLEIRLSIDIARAEAEVALADGGDAIRLRLQDGRWRIVREG
jgi:pSer/pThr/pTyr-binding forkhead associated (FHA) protein